jgi:hypothetical protein
MIEIREDRERLRPLFQDYRWNYLAEAVLDGAMGRAWADDPQAPNVAAVEFPNIGIFVAAGRADHPQARAFLAGLTVPSALIFASPGWEELLREIHGENVIELARYAFTSERLEPAHLQALAANVPAGYTLVPLNLHLAQQLAAEHSPFSEDHLVNFDSPEHFLNQGFGFCLLQEKQPQGEQIACAATTFAVCRRGLEIQINTRESHRRRGLATAAAAKLLLHSLERGLDPNWDAASLESVGLAEKLGYTPQGEYKMFVVENGG